MTPLDGKLLQSHDLNESSQKRLRTDSSSDQMPAFSHLRASPEPVQRPMPPENSSSSSNIHSRRISNITEDDELSVVKRLCERVAQFVPLDEIQNYGYSKESLICIFDKIGFSFAFLPQVRMVLFKYLGSFKNFAPMLSTALSSKQIIQACRELLEVVDSNLEEIHQETLKQFWKMVCGQMNLEERYRNFSYDEIKSYLQSEESRPLRESLLQIFVGKISILPPEIAVFTNLKTVVLDNSLIRERPHILRSRRNLEVHQHQTDFWRYSDTAAWEIPSLMRVWCSLHKQYPNIPIFNTEAEMEEWLDSPLSLEIRKEVIQLDLSHLGLTEFPDALEKFSNLRYLNLSGNQLTSIPNWIGNLDQLDSLCLGGNALDSLPETIENLRQLTLLDISSNMFKELPSVIQHLTELKRLEVSANELQRIPDWISRLLNLRHLFLDYNFISILPDVIGDLYELQILSMKKNCLSQIPSSVSYLSKLECLFVDGNPHLKMIPERVCHLPLKEFACDPELFEALPKDTCIKLACTGGFNRRTLKRKR